jgi:hypothetical protein
LAETTELGGDQYECPIGRRFNPDSLPVLDDQVEAVLWTAVRALQERALLRRRMHGGARSRRLSGLAEEWLAEAQEAERQADRIRSLIETVPPASEQTIAERIAPGRRRARRRAVTRTTRSTTGTRARAGRLSGRRD